MSVPFEMGSRPKRSASTRNCAASTVPLPVRASRAVVSVLVSVGDGAAVAGVDGAHRHVVEAGFEAVDVAERRTGGRRRAARPADCEF